MGLWMMMPEKAPRASGAVPSVPGLHYPACDSGDGVGKHAESTLADDVDEIQNGSELML